MKISDILSEKAVVLLGEVTNKRQLLQELAQKASEISTIPERTIFDAISERENLGSTGFGFGTALPHARSSETDKVFGLFAKLEKPIDFEAIDNKPVDLLFFLLSPENSGADHLSALASCSAILKDEQARSRIHNAQTAKEIYDILLAF